MEPYPLGEPPPRLTVKRTATASLRAGHPWVFANALKNPPGNLPAGCIVELRDEKGEYLGRGSYNDASQIVVRLLTGRDEPVDEALIRRRILAAAARREAILTAETNACRLVFAEADRLPGLIVDRYGDWLVMQLLGAGMEAWRETIVATLAELGPRGVYERSDGPERRRHEGLEPTAGPVWGESPPTPVEIREHGLRFGVDLISGHKTGYYLDQRENRAAVASCCRGRRVLNAFAYTGGFGLYAARAGADEVVHVDSSAPALELARRNAERNDLSAGQEYLEANVFDALQDFRAEGRQFDVIILDPPKFAAGRRQVWQALRGYRELNARALRLLAPEGLLATFSCSGAVDEAAFWQAVTEAAGEAGRTLQVSETLGQPADHPILLGFPEGRYLKGLLARAVD